TRSKRDWSSDVCSSDLDIAAGLLQGDELPALNDPTRMAVGRRDDELAVLGLLGTGERQLVLVLDDRAAALRQDSFADSWRQWGQIGRASCRARAEGRGE